MNPLGGLLWAILKWVLEHTVGLFARSPLEEEFDEPEGGFTEAEAPEGKLLVKLQTGDLLEGLGKVATLIVSGFGDSEIAKIIERSANLRVGKEASYRHQVLFRGERSEFQVFLYKVEGGMCEILFQGSQPLIAELEKLLDLDPV